MRITGRQFAMALAVAVLAHVALATAVFWTPQRSGATAVGLGGIDVSFGPAGGATGSVAAPAPADAAAVEAPDATAVEPDEAIAQIPPDVTANQTTETAEQQPAETLAEPAVPTAELADIGPEEATVTVAATLEQEPVPPEISAVEATDPIPPSPPIQPAETEAVPPLPELVRETATPAAVSPSPGLADADRQDEGVPAVDAPAVAGSAGGAGSQDSPDAGSANDRSAGGSPGSSSDYMSHLLAWLQKHKEYPPAARRRDQEGTVLVYFEMDRDGRVGLVRIEQSSGYKLLDDEVLALIRRAEPLPPPPPDLASDKMKLLVPVEFFLK